MGSGKGLKNKGSAYCTVKYVFIAFNVLLWLLGFGVLTVGVWMHMNRAPYTTLLPNSTFLSATVITICTGAIMFVVGFCGCLGAILESQCVLVTYFVFVLVIFGLEVAATAVCLTHKQEIQDFLHDEVLLSLQQDYKPEFLGTQNGGVVTVVDSIQTNLKCCGVDNKTDWYDIQAWPDENNVPMSCCVSPSQGCGQEGSNALLHSKGCLEEVKFWFMKNMYTLGLLALGIAVLQILTMIGAVAMFCCLRQNKAVL